MNGIPIMRLNELPVDARGLIYFHIRTLEQRLTGKINEDLSLPYVQWREKTFQEMGVGGAEMMTAIRKYGSFGELYDTTSCLTAIQKSLKSNYNRDIVKNLLWKFMDELSFDMGIDPDIVYSYKWDLVNQILKHKLFG